MYKDEKKEIKKNDGKIDKKDTYDIREKNLPTHTRNKKTTIDKVQMTD